MNYRLVLTYEEPERTLYLAVTDYIYSTFFQTTFGTLAQQQHQLNLIVFNEILEVIQEWIE